MSKTRHNVLEQLARLDAYITRDLGSDISPPYMSQDSASKVITDAIIEIKWLESVLSIEQEFKTHVIAEADRLQAGGLDNPTGFG